MKYASNSVCFQARLNSMMAMIGNTKLKGQLSIQSGCVLCKRCWAPHHPSSGSALCLISCISYYRQSEHNGKIEIEPLSIPQRSVMRKKGILWLEYLYKIIFNIKHTVILSESLAVSTEHFNHRISELLRYYGLQIEFSENFRCSL